jgi:predicted transcriptional regulator
MEKNKGDIAWKDLGKFAISLGFARSSVNNAVGRLIEEGIIEKKGPGIYSIKKK